MHPMPHRQLPDRPPFIPMITSDTFELLHSRSSFQAPHSSRSPWQTTRRLGTDRSRVGPLQAGTPGPVEAVTTTEQCSRVDFPEPDGPRSATISPAPTV